MKLTPITEDDLAPLPDGVTSGVPPLTEADLATDTSAGPRRQRSLSFDALRGPGATDPGPPSPMQPPGFFGNMLGLPFDPATQGVTGKHGESGDPLAREIETGAVLNGPAMLLGKGLRYGAGKILGSKGGQAAETLAARGGEAVPGEAESFIASQRLNEARAAARKVVEDLGGAAETMAARNPQVREILELPAKLEAQIAQSHAPEAARKLLKFDMVPSAHSVAVAAGMGGFGHGKFAPLAILADLARQNAAPLAGRMAPLAKRVAGAEALPTQEASLLFQAAMGARNAAP